jgi:hypothetical protein
MRNRISLVAGVIGLCSLAACADRTPTSLATGGPPAASAGSMIALQTECSADPASGETRRLTRGLRARDPDVGPDGTIVATVRQSGGRMQVAVVEKDGSSRSLFEDADGELLFWAGSIAMHVLDRAFAERIAAQADSLLPYHASPKSIPYVDADGHLSVHPREDRTGKEQTVTVKPSYGLDDDTNAEMLLDAIDHGEVELAARNLAEERTEAGRVHSSSKMRACTMGWGAIVGSLAGFVTSGTVGGASGNPGSVPVSSCAIAASASS